MPAPRRPASIAAPAAAAQAGRRARGPRRDCHVVSCFVMVPMRRVHILHPVRAYGWPPPVLSPPLAGRRKRRQALTALHRLDRQPAAAGRQPGGAPGPAQQPLHPPRQSSLSNAASARNARSWRAWPSACSPLHRPAALPGPARPQARPRAMRPPDTPPATARLHAPAGAQPGRASPQTPAPRTTQTEPPAETARDAAKPPPPQDEDPIAPGPARPQGTRTAPPPRNDRSADRLQRRGAGRSNSRRATAAPASASQPRQHTGTRPPTRSGRASPLAPRLLPQAPRPTPGRRPRKPLARGRLAAVATVQPGTALQRRYPLDKTRRLLPKRRVPGLQARNPPSRPPDTDPGKSSTRTIESLPGGHGMSCSVMVSMRMVYILPPVRAYGWLPPILPPLPPARARRARQGGGQRGRVRPPFPSLPPQRCRLFHAAEPFSARNVRARARAWPRALRGGAVRAPDCARAREAAAGRTSPLRSRGPFFRAGAKGGTGPRRGRRLLPPAAW